jgi:hypothetical protein
MPVSTEDVLKIIAFTLMGVTLILLLGFEAKGQSLEHVRALRPKYSPPSTIKPKAEPAKRDQQKLPFGQQDNHRIDSLIDTLHTYNLRIKGVAGYRLQVYTGLDREQAMKTKELLYRNFPDLEVYIAFSQPTFRVKAGDYFKRYDAFRAATRLRPIFPNVLVVEETVKAR